MTESSYLDLASLQSNRNGPPNQTSNYIETSSVSSTTGTSDLPLVLKISINNEIKRIPVAWEPSYEELVFLCRERFKDILKQSNFQIKYFDRSNDPIWVSKDDELREAILHSCFLEDQVRVLRLCITMRQHPISTQIKSDVPASTVIPDYDEKTANELAWMGDFSRTDAETYLKGSPSGTFLTRWNKTTHQIVLSHVRDLAFVHISFIIPLQDGKILVQRQDGTERIYNHLLDYIQVMKNARHIKEPRTKVEIESKFETPYIPLDSIQIMQNSTLQNSETQSNPDEYFYLDDIHFLVEGLLIYNPHIEANKVIFSFTELPLNQTCVTENKNFVTRTSEKEVKFQSKVKPHLQYVHEI